MNKFYYRFLYSLGLATLSFLVWLIESQLGIHLGLWWGIVGAGVVFQILFAFGNRFLNQQSTRRVFGGMAGILALAFKLGWEVFYISYGLFKISTPLGLLLGGLIALTWFYVWLRYLKEHF